MTIDTTIREQVRQRANFACEFCGISETDTGGQLTVDHFRPKSKGGNDSLDNLFYCCIRCNQYKLQLLSQQAELMEEQRRLLKEQRKLLQLLLAKTN